MPKLSEIIAQGKDIHLYDGRSKRIVMKKNKDGWTTLKDSGGSKGAKKGTSKSVVLKEDPIRYLKKLYASQYKIITPANVEIDW